MPRQQKSVAVVVNLAVNANLKVGAGEQAVA